MMQKLLKIGSSAGVTIPKKSLRELGLRLGDNVVVEVEKGNKRVIIKPFVEVDRELFDWTKQFIEKYRQALTALAKK